MRERARNNISQNLKKKHHSLVHYPSLFYCSFLINSETYVFFNFGFENKRLIFQATGRLIQVK